MTKDVLVAIEGLHFGENPSGDKVEVISPGNYYKKNNHHYVLYDEVVEGSDEVIKNKIKFGDDGFSITKRGYSNVDMVFEENKKNITNYITPFGSLLVGIDTDKIDIIEEDDGISIDIAYALDINYEHLADCKIRMNIRPKTEEAVAKLNL